MNKPNLFTLRFLLCATLFLNTKCKSGMEYQHHEISGKEYTLHPSNTLSDKGPIIKFLDSTTVDFGSISAGDTITHIFYFENAGNEPLVIKSATATCGCTVAYFNSQPIYQGKQDSIVARFISNRNSIGFQNKVVTIASNSPMSTIQLSMYGKVR